MTTRTGFLLALTICALPLWVGNGRSALSMPAIVFEQSGDLYAVALDGSQTVRLTETRAGEWEPAVSVDGGRIAFTRQHFHGEGGSIWAMNVDGTHLTRVTRGSDGSPAWAPGGRTLFFGRYQRTRFGPCGSIFRVAANGRGVRRVTNPFARGHSHEDPAVSPDGRRIAFSDWNACAGGTSSPRLRVITASGGPTRDLRRLRHNGYYPDPEHSSAAWSPDGSQLTFLKGVRLNVANRDGSGERQVATVRASQYKTPAWSPDGRWIAFASEDDSGDGYIFIVHPDGSELHRVTETKADYNSLAWLPSLPK